MLHRGRVSIERRDLSANCPDSDAADPPAVLVGADLWQQRVVEDEAAVDHDPQAVQPADGGRVVPAEVLALAV
mgnify:CR=1 FL=1